jgi:hypothetical protein
MPNMWTYEAPVKDIREAVNQRICPGRCGSLLGAGFSAKITSFAILNKKFMIMTFIIFHSANMMNIIYLLTNTIKPYQTISVIS